MIRVAAGKEATAGSRTDGAAGIRVIVLAAVGLVASSSSSAQTWRVTPSISLTETYTDNVDLAPSDRKRSDFITTVTPGLQIHSSGGGRVKLNLDFRTQNNLVQANNSNRNDTLNFLNAVANVEAVDNWLFVDASASISQRAISAFGAQPTTASTLNSNRSETTSVSLSPYIRGRFGSTADYQLRYTLSASGARGNQSADSEVSELTGSLTGRPAPTGFSWAASGSTQTVRNDAGTASEVRRFQGSLIRQWDPTFQTSASAGIESNNFAGSSDESSATYGAGFQWQPSPRTQVSGTKGKRPFGNSHAFSLSYRTPLSVWQYTDSKDITFLPNQLSLGRGTAFELLFDALASRFPDPILRAREVERQLAQSGIPRDLALVTGFLTPRVFVQRSRQASVAILGKRNTLTLTAVLSDSNALSTGSGVPDDFSLASEVQQRSISAALAHRLSPLSSVNLLVQQTHSTGGAGTNLDNTQTSYSLNFAHQIGSRTSGSLSARYTRADNSTGLGFTEKAVTGSVSTTF